MKVIKEELIDLAKAMEDNNSNMKKIDGVDTVVAVDPVYGKALADEEKAKESVEKVMKASAKATDGVTPKDPDTGKPLEKNIYSKQDNDEIELDESLDEAKGNVEALPDDVYTLVYDLIFHGNASSNTHVVPLNQEYRLRADKAYSRLDGYDIGAQILNDEKNEAEYIKKIAKRLGLETYEKKVAGGLKNGDYVLAVKIPDDIAEESAEEFLKKNGFDKDDIRDTVRKKAKNPGKKKTSKKKITESWDDFDKYEEIIDKYMLPKGEGDTLASQAVTAVNKLVYKWFNDGDVYDNTHGLEGWANDLSSYANWLYKYIDGTQDILDRITEARSREDYEDILKSLCDEVLDDELLTELAKAEKQGSVYEADGPFKFEWSIDDDDEEFDEGLKKGMSEAKKCTGKKCGRDTVNRKLDETWRGEDIISDLVERAKLNIDEGTDEDIEDAVHTAIDDGLIYYRDIIDLAEHYGEIDTDELRNKMYDELYSDIYEKVKDYRSEKEQDTEVEAEAEVEVDESKKCKDGKCADKSCPTVEALDSQEKFDAFLAKHPNANASFDWQTFGEFFDDNGELIKGKADAWEAKRKEVFGVEEAVDEGVEIRYRPKFIDALSSTIDGYRPKSERAKDTFKVIKDAGKIDELDSVLDELYPDGIEADDLDYLLADESEMVLGALGIDVGIEECGDAEVFERLDDLDDYKDFRGGRKGNVGGIARL